MWLFAQRLSSGDAAAYYPRGSARGNALAAGNDHPPSESTFCFGILLAFYGASSARAAFHRARTRNSRGYCTWGTEQGDRGSFRIDEEDGRNLFNQHLPETRSRLTGSGSGSRIGTTASETEGKLRTPLFSSSVFYNCSAKRQREARGRLTRRGKGSPFLG